MFDDMIRLRKKWYSIKARCYNESNENYKNYGKKGIKVCEEWVNDFWKFYEWSILNGYQKGLTIDRIDNNLGYFPSNCRYVDYYTQNNNTRRNVKIEFRGETKTIGELAKEFDLAYGVLFDRYWYQKMPIEIALLLPQNRNYNNKTQRRGAEKPIIQKDLNGNLISRYNSLIEAQYETGISRKSISKVLRNINKTAGKYCWEYEVER